VEYRLRHHSGDYRWTLGRALPVRDADGAIIRWIGTCTDIDDAKRQGERAELLSRELSHRIKNIFAVIVGLIGLSARREPAVKTYARELTTRVMALGRAHEYARPHSDDSRREVGEITLAGLLDDLLAPYPARAEGRIKLTGELATNAAKYGALSTEHGRVAVDARLEGDTLVIGWSEEGGPPVPGPPDREGFGTRLASLSVEQQLGGTLHREWRPEGMRIAVTIQASRLVRAKG
jgi:two-component sensor histidine kinase